jgi:integrase
MSADHPTAPAKPSKPRPDFPLFPHATRRWAKKIRGKLHYFGPWDDPEGALKKYLEQKDALHAGRTPREATEGVTIKELCNRFIKAKKALLDSGELTSRSWQEYKDACELIGPRFGKSRLVSDLGPEDFAKLRDKMAKRWGPVRLGNTIQYIRSIFKFAFDAGLIDRPIRFGPGFNRPSKKTLRLHRAEQGPKLFTAEQIRNLIGAADPQLRAMFLLGINAGFGMADCGRLPETALDLKDGWVTYPRPKTGIERRCSLWPETVEAIKAAMEKRPKPKEEEHAGLVFLTAQGRSWHKDDASSPACFKVGQLLKKLGINGRKGLGFYTLRHTFRTVADESKDQPAVDFIMGHEVPHMSSVYRETISDARLRAVTDHVHAWLFTVPATKTTESGQDAQLATRAE